MSSLKEKLMALSGGETSNAMEELKYWIDNDYWLAKSGAIAMMAMDAMEEKGLSQKGLAEKIGVSPQHVHKILQGNENLTLETIGKLEKALNIVIVPNPFSKVKAIRPKPQKAKKTKTSTKAKKAAPRKKAAQPKKKVASR